MAIFLIIGIVGLVVVVLTLIFGEVVEAALNVEVLGGDTFSLASVAAFLGAFGFGGVISLSLIDLQLLAIAVGLVAGFLASWSAVSLTRWLRNSESDSTVRSANLVGSLARVITTIPADGYGEVLISLAGESHKRSARADRELTAGTEVWVMSVLSPTAVEVTATKTDSFSTN